RSQRYTSYDEHRPSHQRSSIIPHSTLFRSTAPLTDVVVLDGGLVPSVSPAGAAQILVVGDRVNQVVGHGFLLLPSRYCLLYQQRGRERNPNTKTAPKPTLRSL